MVEGILPYVQSWLLYSRPFSYYGMMRCPLSACFQTLRTDIKTFSATLQIIFRPSCLRTASALSACLGTMPQPDLSVYTSCRLYGPKSWRLFLTMRVPCRCNCLSPSHLYKLSFQAYTNSTTYHIHIWYVVELVYKASSFRNRSSSWDAIKRCSRWLNFLKGSIRSFSINCW